MIQFRSLGFPANIRSGPGVVAVTMASGVNSPAGTFPMAKFKAARGKKAKTPPLQGGVACLVVVFSVMALVFLVMFFVLKYANG